MKSLSLLAALLIASGAPAQETAKLPDASPAPPSSRLLGPLADGTSPPPAPPKPPYTTRRSDVLDSKTVAEGGRTVTIQRIKPLDLPPPPELAPQPTAAECAALAERVAALRASRPREEFICLGGTLYLSDNRPPRASQTILSFPSDHYEIFSWAADSAANALGKVGNTGEKFSGSRDVVPLLVYQGEAKAHKYHSGQFRSTIQRRWNYWKTTLKQMDTETPHQ